MKHRSSPTIDEQLLEAAEQGDTQKVIDLLKRGADPDYSDAAGFTPLLLAAWAGNHELVGVLLKSRPRVNHCNRDGQTALILAVLGPTVRDKDRYRTNVLQLDPQRTVQILLTNGADVHIKDVRGATALAYANNVKSPAEGILGQRAPAGPQVRKLQSEIDTIIEALETFGRKKPGIVR